jgi:hypothetical protein
MVEKINQAGPGNYPKITSRKAAWLAGFIFFGLGLDKSQACCPEHLSNCGDFCCLDN